MWPKPTRAFSKFRLFARPSVGSALAECPKLPSLSLLAAIFEQNPDFGPSFFAPLHVEMEPSSLLQRYRHDRRKLLDFILSSGLIKEIRTSSSGSTTSLSNINFDVLSADYVLHCIQSGGVLDLSEATKKYTHESTYPVMMQSQLVDSYFLLSDPESSGSPPRRVPPPTEVNRANNQVSYPSGLPDHLVGQKVSVSANEYRVQYAASSLMKEFNIPSLGLPALITGLLDDDLRESAYEIFLACLAFYGVEIHSIEDQKKEKASRFLAGLKNKREKRHVQSKSPERHPDFIDIIRVQMQISEAMDACVRQRLKQFASGKACGQIEVPQISLALLNSILKSDFPSEKSYTQFKNRQVSILEELFSSVNHMVPDQQKVGTLLKNIRNSKDWDISISPHQHAEVILAIKDFASILSSVPGHFGMQGETCYWTASYHLNIRLYEKLLFSLFDILEEGQLIEEAEEILKLLKLTWSTLGITQKMHNALYGYSVFINDFNPSKPPHFKFLLVRKFVETDEVMLLDHSIVEVKKVLSAEDNEAKEEQYVNSLTCLIACNGSGIRLNLVHAVFWSISLWCDSKLQDYHLHFVQKPGFFRKVMTMALTVGTCDSGECGQIELMKSDDLSKIASRKVRMYIESSVQAANRRIEDIKDLGSKIEETHPLALLASELRLIAERELTVFYPVLRHWCSEAGMVAAVLIHQIFGERLKPFLEGVLGLSEDVRLVLPAADMLEHKLAELYCSACKENGLHSSFNQEFDSYQIGKISSPIILDWVIDQHARILEWTGRAFALEDWEPLSIQQKQAASAVEVFRIIEETVDQFFELNLPMDITHLQALLSIIFHTLDGYLLKLVSQLGCTYNALSCAVDKQHLYPCTPSLTRYEETIFPIIKKKVVEHILLEEEVNKKLNKLTVPKLCIRLNTLQYIQRQIGSLEDGIRKSWASVRPSKKSRCSEEPPDTSDGMLDSSESVDELFVATIDCIRDTASHYIKNICDFTGARVVFWDLRESFLFHLYHGTIEGARLDSIIPHFDTVLNHVCGTIDDALRDLVVSSICRASLEGYVWVLLDGGPSRAFSDSDIPMMEEDLNILKDLFVADGEGLPRSLVEVEATLAHQILNLFSLQTESVIRMLMNASEHISTGSESSHKMGLRVVGDAHTLIRVLCHKKDGEASKFLKRNYHLPASSEYDDSLAEEWSSKSPMVSEFLKSASSRWSGRGNSSFRSIQKRLLKVRSDRYGPH
ncbi:hypothetical protein LguiB_028819 [Lonicera macranthoides]